MIGVMPAYCLAFQTSYRCAHAGACCTAGWQIPVEEETINLLKTHGLSLPTVLKTSGGCEHYDHAAGGSCAIHRTAGTAGLPSACRQFPRVTLTDPRGTFVTLSNYCPTAAALLTSDASIHIVDAPDDITLGGRVEGLDATHVMPPLLRPGLLMDYEGYAAWERAALRALDDRAMSADAALDVIDRATRAVVCWSPGTASLTGAVEEAFAGARRSVPDVDPRDEQRPMKMFLASHLFASWAAYQRGGLAAIIDDVRRAQRLVQDAMAAGTPFVDAVRGADLRMRHT